MPEPMTSPPNTPTVLTLFTRPWSSCGSGRRPDAYTGSTYSRRGSGPSSFGGGGGVGLNQTLAALVTQRQARSGEFGVTRERIRQIESKTLAKLRPIMGKLDLKLMLVPQLWAITFAGTLVFCLAAAMISL